MAFDARGEAFLPFAGDSLGRATKKDCELFFANGAVRFENGSLMSAV